MMVRCAALLACTTIATAALAETPANQSFEATVALHGITFKVTSPNAATANTVTITPQGLSADNAPQTMPVPGPVTKAEIADLNIDKSPEIYVMGHDATADKRGFLVAYSANARKSLSTISLPALTKAQSRGYRGADEFAAIETSFARRFPIFSADGKPTGKMRQLQYKLRHGEASWKFVVTRVAEF